MPPLPWLWMSSINNSKTERRCLQLQLQLQLQLIPLRNLNACSISCTEGGSTPQYQVGGRQFSIFNLLTEVNASDSSQILPGVEGNQFFKEDALAQFGLEH